MKKKKSIYIVLMMSLFISFISTGCTTMENLKIKFGLKNLDFEYIKQNKVDKIVIQSTRDQGFRFVVTDKKTISELYDILSSAKSAKEKSSLDPDYVFEMYEDGNTVHKFNYVTGLEKEEVGNLYSDDKEYIVSKRIDNDIIRNLWNLRKPREFEKVYYGSILKVLQTYKDSINGGKKVGIVISDDVEVAKYIFSMDLENFKGDLSKVMSNAELVQGNKEDFDVLINVKTQGYKTDKYRSVITVYNKENKSEQKYYTGCKHENGEWSIQVGTKAYEP